MVLNKRIGKIIEREKEKLFAIRAGRKKHKLLGQNLTVGEHTTVLIIGFV